MRTAAEIGERVVVARRAAGLSTKALAEKAGVHRNTIVALETGKGNTGLVPLLAILGVLGLEVMLVPREVAGFSAPDAPTADTELSKQIGALMGKKS